jgi:hypothetical protein
MSSWRTLCGPERVEVLELHRIRAVLDVALFVGDLLGP